MQKNNINKSKTTANKPDFENMNSTTSIVIIFLQECLLLFREKNVKNYDEWLLNQKLEILLNQESRNKQHSFIFKGEYIDDNVDKNRKVDIAVISVKNYETEAFFTIEAKRLRLPKSETKHYVCGNTGGIERFKREQHGKGLLKSAMVGYVEHNGFDYWLKIINSWIKSLWESNKEDNIQWSESDLLKSVNNDTNLAQYFSTHSRISDSSISLSHLWIKMY